MMSPLVLILCVAINALWILPVILELFIFPFMDYRKRNQKEKELLKIEGPRLNCINCDYCKRKLYKPFYNSYHGAQYVPSWCRKFQIKLPWDTSCRCKAYLPEQAERQNTSQHITNKSSFEK